MTLKFTVHGVEVTATDAVEAAKLIRELAAQAKSTPAPSAEMPAREPVGRIKRNRPLIPLRKRLFIVSRATVAFLDAVNQGGEDGVKVDEIMPALAANKPKGTGARLAKVNDHLRKLGFQPEDVYSNQRTRKGRVWVAQSKMSAALEAARKAER